MSVSIAHPGRRRRPAHLVGVRHLIAGSIAVALAGGGATAALAGTPTAAPQACSPCVYHVTPGGSGSQNLAYVLQHLVQSHDTVVLADGVYRVANLQVTAPDVTIVAQHVPPAGAAPTVWLDGSVPYRWWNHPSPHVWAHAYARDFCNTTTPQLPCTQVGAPYHSDQVFRHGE